MIGRDKEQAILRELVNSDHSELAVVYGRRRVGKTFLVRETFDYHFAFSHTGVENGTLRDELFAFWDSLKDAGHECDRPVDWWTAFAELKASLRKCPDAKKVIFLDELPWMDTRKSGFVKALESFWNGWASARRDIFLVVCGSAAAWMVKNVLQSRGGLFNRASRQIYLQPFTLNECERFVKSKKIEMDRGDIVKAYMVFGGAA
ncbi:MAG: AAA family ATPase [Kiritimatiellae bacterium]|nr:AAA family ATPase [Kiritimatiellia bacterium]